MKINQSFIISYLIPCSEELHFAYHSINCIAGQYYNAVMTGC